MTAAIGRFLAPLLLAAGLLLAPLAASVAPAVAQLPPEDDPAPAASQPAGPDDLLGRTTPAGTMSGFVDAIAALDYSRAAQYLDLSHLTPWRRTTAGPDLARDLQRALDRGGSIAPSRRLSEDPEGELADGLDRDRESVGTLGTGEEVVPLLLRRVEVEGVPLWLISGETLEAARELGRQGGGGLADSWLPEAASEQVVGGAPIAHWLTLLGATLVFLAVLLLGWRLLLLVLKRFGLEGSRVRQLVRVSYRPLALLLALLIASAVAPALGISFVARQAYGWLIAVIAPLVVGWVLLRVVDAVSDQVLARLERASRATATSIVRFAARVAKAAVVALTLLAVLDAFGFDVTAIIAALGIGGLALALGAQRTVENLIASLSIISDRPLRVGDFCQIGDTVGTVEDIGMRSTRIRTLGRTVVTIPNSNLVSSAIENFAPRDRFWFNPLLHVSSDTPPDKLRELLAALRGVLDGDGRLAGQTARVRLLVPANDRLPIEIFGYVLAADYDEFLKTQEDLTLRLLDAVAAHKLTLAHTTLNLRTPGAQGLPGIGNAASQGR